MDDDDYEYEDEQEGYQYDDEDDGYEYEDEQDDDDDDEDSDEDGEDEDEDEESEDEDGQDGGEDGNAEGESDNGNDESDNKDGIKGKLNSIKDAIKKPFAKIGHIIMGVISVVGPPLAVFAIIFVVVLAIAQFLYQLCPFLFTGFGDDDTPPSITSSYGVKADSFYGLRTIYKDENLAKSSLIEQYYNTIIEIKTQLDANADLNITITLLNDEKLPTEIENFDYLTFETEYSGTALFALVDELANVVYAGDNLVDYTEAQAVAFDEKLAGIKYFGIGQSASAQAAEKVANYIFNNNLMVADPATGSSGATTLPSQENLTSAVGEIMDAMDHTRAEKLFVQDYILSGDENTISTGSKNYVAMIFMPKTNVEIQNFSFEVYTFDNFDNLELSVLNNPDAKLTKSLFMEGANGGALYQFDYSSSSNATLFEDVDKDNLSALADGLSVYDILTGTLNNEIYLKTLEIDGVDDTIYTLKISGTGVQFNFVNDVVNSTPFIAGQYIVNYKNS